MGWFVRAVIATGAVLAGALGCREPSRPASPLVPEWATPGPETGYDAKSGLPKEVIHAPTRLRLLLISPGTYEWPDPDTSPPFRGYPRSVTIQRAFYATDGSYFPPGARLGSITAMPEGFRLLAKDEATASLFVLVRLGELDLDWPEGFVHEGIWHVAIGHDP